MFVNKITGSEPAEMGIQRIRSMGAPRRKDIYYNFIKIWNL